MKKRLVLLMFTISMLSTITVYAVRDTEYSDTVMYGTEYIGTVMYGTETVKENNPDESTSDESGAKDKLLEELKDKAENEITENSTEDLVDAESLEEKKNANTAHGSSVIATISEEEDSHILRISFGENIAEYWYGESFVPGVYNEVAEREIVAKLKTTKKIYIFAKTKDGQVVHLSMKSGGKNE